VLHRHLAGALTDALADTPAVMVVGARQTGKTTLVRGQATAGGRYHTLDDLDVLDAATTDPVGFVAGLAGPAAGGGAVIIDEIQKAPRLLPALKAAIDRDRRPGRFLLTGSANVLALPTVAESLAGRMEVLTLWPLSQGELAAHREAFIDRAFAGGAAPTRGRGADVDLGAVVEAVVRGGYPEATARARPDRRRAFFTAYVTTLLTRDVRDLAAIEDPGALRRLLQLCAARTGAMLNHAELSRTLAVPVSTVKRYLALLEAMYLVHAVPAWASNRGKRLAKAAKVHLVDTGLAAAMIGVDAAALVAERTALGPLLETFVAGEVARQLGWSEVRPTLHHFRTHGGQEVDLVLEDARGRVVGIEVKASATVTSADLAGMRALADLAGSRFVQGIVLHLGPRPVTFAPGFSAWPLDALWT
jgi:predicted AAA+ superfamily ATPase